MGSQWLLTENFSGGNELISRSASGADSRSFWKSWSFAREYEVSHPLHVVKGPVSSAPRVVLAIEWTALHREGFHLCKSWRNGHSNHSVSCGFRWASPAEILTRNPGTEDLRLCWEETGSWRGTCQAWGIHFSLFLPWYMGTLTPPGKVCRLHRNNTGEVV